MVEEAGNYTSALPPKSLPCQKPMDGGEELALLQEQPSIGAGLIN